MTQTESLMTTPAPTNNAAVASTESPTGDVSNAVVTQDQPVADATETGNTEGDSKDAPKTEAVGAPEKYEFKAPEGKNFDNEVITTYSQVARELNLSQASAQKMLDTLGPKLAERQMAQIDSIRQGWVDSSRIDKEFGGESLDKNMSVAKKALDTFGTPELRTVLNQSGLGNHPEIIRFFFRAGKSISEDGYVGPSSGSGSKGQPRDFASQASMLYSNQKS